MALLDEVLKRVTSGDASPDEVHGAYDEVAQSAPRGTLAQGLAHAFNSDQTPPFEQMLSGLFSQSSPDQKAALLNQILATLGSGGAAQVGSSGQAGGLASALAKGSVTPQQAQQIPPADVQVLAQQAAEKNPSIVDTAASFYAQHPTLVKTIGAGALAVLMSKISAARSQP
jgi:hypothetical protein